MHRTRLAIAGHVALFALLLGTIVAINGSPAPRPARVALPATDTLPNVPGGGAAGPAAVPAATASGAIGTVMIGGRASWVRPSLGDRYLAMRFRRGTIVRICGQACLLRVVTDFGPSSRIRPYRIADMSAADFRVVCGPLSMGTCRVSAELLEKIVPPATDSE